jgi:hypothetical protein
MLNLVGVSILKRFYLEETQELTEAPSYEGWLIVLMEDQLITLSYNQF